MFCQCCFCFLLFLLYGGFMFGRCRFGCLLRIFKLGDALFQLCDLVDLLLQFADFAFLILRAPLLLIDIFFLFALVRQKQQDDKGDNAADQTGEEASNAGKQQIDLIDGTEFINKLIEYRLGVTEKTIYEVDKAFFEKV